MYLCTTRLHLFSEFQIYISHCSFNTSTWMSNIQLLVTPPTVLFPPSSLSQDMITPFFRLLKQKEERKKFWSCGFLPLTSHQQTLSPLLQLISSWTSCFLFTTTTGSVVTSYYFWTCFPLISLHRVFQNLTACIPLIKTESFPSYLGKRKNSVAYKVPKM
jgi:hypothetical protein